MYEEEFPKRLSELRNAKGVSAREMSLAIGQNPSYINNIETGKSLPSMSAFLFICDYLNIMPQDFFDTDSTAPEEFRVARLMAREGIPEDYARLRIRAQKSNDVFAANCSVTIDNRFDSAAQFMAHCKATFQQLL
jgi:transcriptional regulator with XRE-family HTH domain